jgi:hypothetical protein
MRESSRHTGVCGYGLKDNLLEVTRLLKLPSSLPNPINLTKSEEEPR